MKKKFVLTLFAVVLIGVYCYIRLPDYEVHNSISFSNRGIRETELNVIVYRLWGIDEMAERIKDEYDTINGTPTTLEIKVYFSEWHLRKAKPFRVIIYEELTFGAGSRSLCYSRRN